MKPASRNSRIVKAAVAIALIAGGAATWTWAGYATKGEMDGIFEQRWEVAVVEAHNRNGAHIVQGIAELTPEECMAAAARYLDLLQTASDREIAGLTAAMIVQVGAAGLCLVGGVVGLVASRRPKKLPPVFAPEVVDRRSAVDRPRSERVARQEELVA